MKERSTSLNLPSNSKAHSQEPKTKKSWFLIYSEKEEEVKQDLVKVGPLEADDV